jgi:preprotein translocase subunit SecA
MVSQLSEAEQKEVDQLNDDIRKLTEECKKMFSERLQLQYDRELLLKSTLTKQHERLTEVSLHIISSSHPQCVNLQVADSRIISYDKGTAPSHMF